jgi:hypothetical protein
MLMARNLCAAVTAAEIAADVADDAAVDAVVDAAVGADVADVIADVDGHVYDGNFEDIAVVLLLLLAALRWRIRNRN